MASPEHTSGYGIFVPQAESEFKLDTDLIPTIDLQSLIISGTSRFIKMDEALVRLEQEDTLTADITTISLRPDVINPQFAAEIDHPLSNEELIAMFTAEELRGAFLYAAFEYGEHKMKERDALIQGLLRGMAIERKKEQLDKAMETDPDLIIIREAVEQFPIDDSGRFKQNS